MIKTGLNNERTRVCLCLSGDAVHREEAAESSVSLYDLNFLCGSPLSWILTVLFSLSVSHWACLSDLWPLQVCADWHSGSDWSLHLVCVWNHHHRGSGSSARCCFPPLSVDPWHSVYIRPVCFRRLPSPASSSTWWTRPAASTPSHSCPTCCTPAGTSPSDYFYRRLGVILILLSTNYISNNIILLSRLIAELYEHDDIMKTTLTSQQ